MIRQISMMQSRISSFQVMEAHEIFFGADLYVLSEKLNAPHRRQNTNAKFARSYGGGFADVNLRSLIELQKRLVKVKVSEVRLVWSWKSSRERSKIVSRCIQRSYIPRGFVDTLFRPQSFRLAQLLVGVAKLVLSTRISEPSRKDYASETDQAPSKAFVRCHSAADPFRPLGVKDAYEAAGITAQVRLCVRKCKKTNNGNREPTPNSNAFQPSSKLLHKNNVPGTSSFVDRVAA